MNIHPDIQQLANLLGLEMIGTGGGCDYVHFAQDNKGPSFLLVGAKEDGSPSSTDKEAILVLYRDDEWTQYTQFQFDSAVRAMVALANPSFRASALWHSLDQLWDSEEVEPILNAYYPFTDKDEAYMADSDETRADFSRLVLQVFGAQPVEE